MADPKCSRCTRPRDEHAADGWRHASGEGAHYFEPTPEVKGGEELPPLVFFGEGLQQIQVPWPDFLAAVEKLNLHQSLALTDVVLPGAIARTRKAEEEAASLRQQLAAAESAREEPERRLARRTSQLERRQQDATKYAERNDELRRANERLRPVVEAARHYVNVNAVAEHRNLCAAVRALDASPDAKPENAADGLSAEEVKLMHTFVSSYGPGGIYEFIGGVTCPYGMFFGDGDTLTKEIASWDAPPPSEETKPWDESMRRSGSGPLSPCTHVCDVLKCPVKGVAHHCGLPQGHAEPHDHPCERGMPAKYPAAQRFDERPCKHCGEPMAEHYSGRSDFACKLAFCYEPSEESKAEAIDEWTDERCKKALSRHGVRDGEKQGLVGDMLDALLRRNAHIRALESDLAELRKREVILQRWNRRLTAALDPFIAKDAPATEGELGSVFWRTIAVSKSQHETAEAVMRPPEPASPFQVQNLERSTETLKKSSYGEPARESRCTRVRPPPDGTPCLNPDCPEHGVKREGRE